MARIRRMLSRQCPERFGGELLVVVGLALVAIGAFEMVALAAFDSVLDGVLEPLRAAGDVRSGRQGPGSGPRTRLRYPVLARSDM